MRPLRYLWLAAGHACLALGVAGIFVPLLPTTPFLLLASFCYSQGSERFETWLVSHPKLGPVIRSWRSHRVIPPRVKVIACLTIAASVAWVTTRKSVPVYGKAGMLAVVLPVAVFIVTRRSRPPEAQSPVANADQTR